MEGNGILSAINLFEQGFLCIPVKNHNKEMRIVSGHRARELTHPLFLLDEFKAQYKQEPDGWAAVCGYRGVLGYLVYIDAEEEKIAETIREKIKIKTHDYREEFGSKGAHFPIIITDKAIEKRTEFHSDKKMTSENLVMEVLTDWLCMLPGSIHRKTGKEYSTRRDGAIPKMKKAELIELLETTTQENGLFYRQKRATAPQNQDEELTELKIRLTFFELGFKPGLQSCPLPGHKNKDAHPSLSVSVDGRVANCFSVHGGMDVLKFIQLHEGCDFPTAKRLLLKKLDSPNTPNGFGVFSNDVAQENAPNAPNEPGSKCTNAPTLYGGAYKVGAGGAGQFLKKKELIVLTYPNITADMMTEPDYLVEKMVARATTNVLGGKSEAFKSAITFYILSKIATGGKIWGGLQCKEGVVWYIDEDQGQMKTINYIQKVRNALSEEDKVKFDKNFFFSTSQNLKIDEDFDLVKDFIEKNHPTIIAADAFVAVHSADENDAGEIRRLFKENIQMLSEQYGVSWLLLHHNRKTMGVKNKNDNEDDEMDRMRGSGDIAALCTGCFYMRRVSPEDGDVVFKMIKNRLGEKMKPRRLFMVFDDEAKTLNIQDGGEAVPEMAKDSEMAEKIIEWITINRPETITTSEILAKFGKDGTTQRAIKMLKDNRRVLLNARSPFKIDYNRISRLGELGDGAKTP